MSKKVVKQMTNTKVTHVSLVENPANEESFLMLKSSGENVINIVVKSEDICVKSEDVEKQLIYGIVYSPDKLDADGEFMSADDIEKAAHGFLAEFRNIDGEHDFVTKCGVPVESYIVPEEMTIGERVVKKGSWLLVVKATNDAWESVKKGEFTGFSLAGKTIRKNVEVEVDEEGNVIKNSVLKTAVNGLLGKLGFVKKDFNTKVENAENNDIYYYLDLFYYAVCDAYWSSDTETVKEEIAKSVKQFLDKINDMSFVYKSKESKGNSEEEKMDKEFKEQIEALQKSLGEMTERLATVEKSVTEVKESVTTIEEVVDKSVDTLGAVIKKITGVEKMTMQSGQQVEAAPEEKTQKSRKFNALAGGFKNEE